MKLCFPTHDDETVMNGALGEASWSSGGVICYGATRQGDVVFHDDNCLLAHAVSLSVWQEVHGLGILYLSVIAGVMKRKV